MKNYDIKDPSLADEGKLRIEWAGKEMPVNSLIKQRFGKAHFCLSSHNHGNS